MGGVALTHPSRMSPTACISRWPTTSKVIDVSTSEHALIAKKAMLGLPQADHRYNVRHMFEPLSAAEAEETFKRFADIVKTGNAPEEFDELAAFAGVHTFPARIKCATLSWHAALEALKQPETKP